MEFYPGFAISSRADDMDFEYGDDVFHPQAEQRTLESIRASLQDPTSNGPAIPYSIVMDVGRIQDEIWRGKLKKLENLEMSTVGHGIWQEN